MEGCSDRLQLHSEVLLTEFSGLGRVFSHVSSHTFARCNSCIDWMHLLSEYTEF